MMLTITSSYPKGNTYVYRDETKRHQIFKRETLVDERQRAVCTNKKRTTEKAYAQSTPRVRS